MRLTTALIHLIAVLAAAGLIGAAPDLPAEEVLREISWAALSSVDHLEADEIIVAENGAVILRVANPDDQPRTFTVLTLNDPGITADRYAVEGAVAHRDVEGEGYLEMWSHFPDGRSFFSRTLGGSGPLRNLAGTSDWRRFHLPFSINDDSAGQPVQLEINVHLPGRGTVDLGEMRLVQFTADEEGEEGVHAGQWWNEQSTGRIGGVLGPFFGVLAGVIGILGGMGKARRLVIALLAFGFLSGVVLLVFGLAALILSQPPHVFSPLLLVGIVDAVVFGGFLFSANRLYTERELRRIKALDVS